MTAPVPVTVPVTTTRRRSSLAVPVSALAGNALAYGLLLLAARALTADRYGSFVALLTVMVVGAIPSLALQAVAAGRVARGEPTGGVAALAVVLAAGCAVTLAALAVPVNAFLHIDSLAATLWLAASLAPLTLSGALIGAAQGLDRPALFGGLSLVQAIGRFGGALVPLVAFGSEAAAMAGAAVGSAVATGVAYVLVTGRERAWSPSWTSPRGAVLETAHALHGYAVVLVLTSLDVLLARHVVAPGQAAQYAAGSVVTKAVTWLPQSVGLLVFARMTADEHRLRIVRRALAAVAGFGLVTAAGCALFPGLVTAVIGGDFDGLASSAWIFALLGTGLAVLQFTVVVGLAARRPRRLVVLWAATVVEVVVVLSTGRDESATAVVATVTVIVLAAALVASWLAAGRTLRRATP